MLFCLLTLIMCQSTSHKMLGTNSTKTILFCLCFSFWGITYGQELVNQHWWGGNGQVPIWCGENPHKELLQPFLWLAILMEQDQHTAPQNTQKSKTTFPAQAPAAAANALGQNILPFSFFLVFFPYKSCVELMSSPSNFSPLIVNNIKETD